MCSDTFRLGENRRKLARDEFRCCWCGLCDAGGGVNWCYSPLHPHISWWKSSCLSLLRAFPAHGAWKLTPPLTDTASIFSRRASCPSAVPRFSCLSLSHLSPLRPQNCNCRFVFCCYGEAGDGVVVLLPVFVETARDFLHLSVLPAERTLAAGLISGEIVTSHCSAAF